MVAKSFLAEGGSNGYAMQVVKTSDLTKESDLALGAYPNAVAIDSANVYAGRMLTLTRVT